MIALALIAAATLGGSSARQREALGEATAFATERDPLKAAAELADIEELFPHLGPIADLLRQVDLGTKDLARDARPGAGEAWAWARLLGVRLEFARGRPERTADRMEGLGFPSAAWIQRLPEGSGGCGAAEPPPPVGGDWREFHGAAPTGVFELEQLLTGRQGETAAIATGLDVDARLPAAIFLGTSGRAAIALDGAWLGVDAGHHPAHPGQLRLPLTLSPGHHVVLLEVCRDERPLEASLRVAAPDGRPLAQLRFSAPGPPPAPRAGKATPIPVSQLVQLASKATGDAAADVLEALDPFDDARHEPWRARDAACHAEPTEDCWLDELALARRGRRGIDAEAALARAVAAGPVTPRLRLAQADLWLELGYPDRALGLAREARGLDPDDDQPLLLEAQALEALGMQGLAAARELEAAKRFPGSPDAQMAGAYRNERLHRSAEARGELRLLLGLRPDLLGARETLDRLLLAAGDVTGALEVIEGGRSYAPLSARPLLQEAQIWLGRAAAGAAGEADRSRGGALAKAAADLGRWNGDALGQLAELELAAGDEARGRADLRAALALEPQAPLLRSLDRQLGARADDFSRRYLANLVEVARASPPIPGEDAVVLSDATAVEVFPSGLSSRVHQLIVRAQTQRGVEASRVTPIEYDPDRQELRILSARLLEPDGHVATTFEESSRSLSEPWYGLYYDQRERDVSFPSLAPGDVLEVAYRLDDVARENLLRDSFGDIVFLQDTVPRERFVYAVSMPPGRDLASNQPEVPSLSRREEKRPDGGKSWIWTAGAVPKLLPEPQMPGWAEIAPYLEVSTERSWAALGDSYWELVRSQLEPTAKVASVADELADGAGPSIEARVAAAYDFVVSHTRYVGLELGIHGYRPYPVGEVLDRGFGDCKDKASLLWSLLHSIGIDSRLVLVRTRPLGRLADGPASFAVFDHAILYVPALDRFLDATARFHGSRELPEGDQGASALVISPNGQSRLVTVPSLPAASNGTTTTLAVALAADGSATLQGSAEIRGSDAAEYRRSYQPGAGRRSLFEQGWSRTYPELAVRRADFEGLTDLEKPVRVTFDLAVPRLASRQGDRLRLQPFGAAASYAERFAPLSKRRFAVALPPPWTQAFDYRIGAPEGLRFSAPPQSVREITPFGDLEVDWALAPDSRSLTVHGHFAIAVSEVSPSRYAAFRSFLEAADRALSTPAWLTHSEPPRASR